MNFAGSALAPPDEEVRMVWQGRQSEAFLDETRYLDVEGAIRSAKTTLALWKQHDRMLRWPGLNILIARWTDDSLNTTVAPLWRDILHKTDTEFHPHPKEHYDEIVVRDEDGREIGRSRAYLMGLRSSEDSNRFGKFRGLTLGGVYLDQAEEVPHDVYLELKGRLSQVLPYADFTPQMLLTPNPAGESHWLSTEFPEDNRRANHRLIRLSLYDNAHNLDAAYIADLEQAYPVGHPLRRRLIEGKRGLSVVGKPVYAGYFNRSQVQPIEMNPALPLLELIDFGHHHPAALWLQFEPTGYLHLLGGVMGEDLFIEDFAPLIKQFRAAWFPSPQTVWAGCDPAGSHQNSQGTRKSGVDVLRDNDIYPRWVDSANQPEVRSYAVETIGGYMRRDRFRVHPDRWYVVSNREARRMSVAVDALEAGYVWDERLRRISGGKQIAVPLKDGYYEHLMNCLEYGVITFGPAQPAKVDEQKLERQALARAQKDYDPADARRGRGMPRGRGGY